MAELYERYEALKRDRRVIDFDDLLTLVVAEMARDGAYADAVRWRYRHLFVDEYQDVNPLQQALLEAWRGGRPDLCVVGDPQQAIYGWNGADGRWLEDFTAHHPGATVVHLRRSHRSTPQIVGLGHAVLTGSGEGGPVASRPDGAPPRAIAFAGPEAEAAGVAAIVRDVRPPGGRWRAIAVLARTNAQLQPVAAALTRAGIPHRRRAGPIDDPATAAALVELRSVTGPGSLRAWLEDTLGGTGRPDESAGEDADEDAGHGIVAGAGGQASTLPAAFVRAAEDLLAQDPAADGPTLRAWLISGGSDGLAVDDDAVALSTFHAAKGLEWPTVVVIGLVPGLVPHTGARTPAARDEERRLLHVAVTRAEREVVLTWYGPERSPYLDVLDQAVPVGGPPVAPPPDLRPVPNRPPADPLLVALRDVATRRRPRRPHRRAGRGRRPHARRDRRRAPSDGRGAGRGPRVRPAHGATPRDSPAGRDRSRPPWARAGASVSALTGRPSQRPVTFVRSPVRT